MTTRTLLYIYKVTLICLFSMMLFSCTDTLVEEQGHGTSGDGKEQGELVQFSAGTTENAETRARTYYMPDSYRFICRMYYKAQTGSDDFDVTSGTDITAWLKVSGNVGNSLYWNKYYTEPERKDDYGNDYNAPAFYWQNRKEHAFLAWTNLNDAVHITGGTTKGSLKFGEDLKYKVYTGVKQEQWVMNYYKVYGDEEHQFSSMSAMREYVEKNITSEADIENFNAKQCEIGDQYTNWNDEQVEYSYQFGWSCKYTSANCATERQDEKHETYGWYRYMMFFNKVDYTEPTEDLTQVKDKDGIILKLKDSDGRYVAEAEVTNRKNEEGKYLDDEDNVIPVADYGTKLHYKYYATDAEGNVRYDETQPKYTFYFKQYRELKQVDVYNEFPALAFDLTRGSKTNMGQQPDIAQALEIQAPVGALQESNRVNLYFKHKFSQIQVNIQNARDNSVELTKEDILNVELLGVTEEGYIFTEIDEQGRLRDAAYKDIDFSKYSEAQLRDNPYGTSFEMFKMSEAETDLNSLKSYNAIAFGQLQAIRVTWKESGEDGYPHAATFRIPNTELVNLESGKRYIWNIEVRRGTLAIIRTEIVDWELPTDELHNGNIDGTIQN